MTNLDWKEEIKHICTYYSELGEGTCGYSLSNEQFEKLFNLVDSILHSELNRQAEEIQRVWIPELRQRLDGAIQHHGEFDWVKNIEGAINGLEKYISSLNGEKV